MPRTRPPDTQFYDDVDDVMISVVFLRNGTFGLLCDDDPFAHGTWEGDSVESFHVRGSVTVPKAVEYLDTALRHFVSLEIGCCDCGGPSVNGGLYEETTGTFICRECLGLDAAEFAAVCNQQVADDAAENTRARAEALNFDLQRETCDSET
jgi:hypothetical protein